MRISVVGTGYVGLCTALGFVQKGHAVTCVDIDPAKVGAINEGRSPFYEPGVKEALRTAINGKRLAATTGLRHAIDSTDITFIAVGTPALPDGRMDMSHVERAADDVAAAVAQKVAPHTIVIKSTVLPGTTEVVLGTALAKHNARAGIAMNPEFLREGSALHDVLNPDRIIIGADSQETASTVADMYKEWHAPVLTTSIKAAEMIKYASNALLATKVSFANEVGNLCKKLGIDTYEVMRGVGLDHRLGPHFLDAGCGFGGSCFPKDVTALAGLGEDNGIEMDLIRSVIAVNDAQKHRLVALLEDKIGDLAGKRIAVLGLAFKAGTDDVRDSVAITVLEKLVEKGADVVAYDPVAEKNMKTRIPRVTYSKSVNEALTDSDACLILTDWDEFKTLSDSDFSVMKNKIIIEGRRTLNADSVSEFEGICW